MVTYIKSKKAAQDVTYRCEIGQREVTVSLDNIRTISKGIFRSLSQNKL